MRSLTTATTALRSSARTVFLVLPLIIHLGCTGRTNLPESVVVELPDGTETEVTLGSGVLSLANTTWQFFATSPVAQSAPFVTISFGPNGELDKFEDNTFSNEIFGDTIYFDAERHDTNQQGLSYAAATFGAETSDARGFAFVAQLNAFFAGVQVATGTANASGTFDPEDPNVMTGTFDFVTTIEVEIPGVPTGDQEVNFTFRATRVQD